MSVVIMYKVFISYFLHSNILQVLSDKNFHKDKTFTAHKVLVIIFNH